jgi:hypothetical protein
MSTKVGPFDETVLLYKSYIKVSRKSRISLSEPVSDETATAEYVGAGHCQASLCNVGPFPLFFYQFIPAKFI